MRRMIKYIQIVILAGVGVLLTANVVKGQDQQYTQFYANPMNLSPAFAGTGLQSRMATTYRNQWPALPRAFVSYNVAFDHFISDINSGVALTIHHDRAGTGGMSFTSAALHYAYEVNLTRKLSFRPALNVGFGSNFIDITKLTFMDQLVREEDGVTTLDPDRGRFIQKPINYPDFGTGFLLFSDFFWFGAALSHINQPIQSFTGGDSYLPRKLGFHGGIRFKLSDVSAFKSRQHIVPAFNYQMQGKFDQLDLGFYYEYDPMIIGLWYRGLPIFKKNGYKYMNHDALALLIGYSINNMKIAYSYDLTISKLSPNSGGAHEISIVMEFISKNKKTTKRRVVPCAKF